MKSNLFYLLILSVAFASSCKEQEEKPIDQAKESFTDDSIIVKDLTNYSNTASERGTYHLLGYGYDVTGEYADSSSARKQIVDPVKLKSTHPSAVVLGRSRTAGGHVYAPGNAGEFSRQISRRVNDSRFFGLKEQEHKRYFKNEIVNYFLEDETLLSKWIYGAYLYKLQQKNVKMMGIDLHKYVLPAFASDVQTSSPIEIVNKYGTHILTSIDLGAKLMVTYKAETVYTDREKAAALGITVSLSKVFGMFSGHLDYVGLESAKGNFSQKISFKASGADVSKIKITTNTKTKLPFIDITDWHRSSTEQNAELVDIQSIVPIYEAIEDPIKKAQVKKYVEEYLLSNAINIP